MKKQMLWAAMFFMGLVGIQAQQGSILLQGDVSYNRAENTNTDVTNEGFAVSPYLGYQFTENLTIGAEGSFGLVKSDTAGTKTDYDYWSLGGFLRYTQPLGDIFAIYGQASGGFFNGTQTNSEDGWYVNVFPALFINLKNNFGLNFNIGGARYESQGDENGLNLSFGKEVGVGISKNFKL